MRQGSDSLAAFRALVRKEVYHILRDRRTLAVVVAMPIVQVLLFGYALQTDVEEIRLVVVDPAPDVRSRQLVERFAATAEYRVIATLAGPDRLADAFERRAADQALVFEPGFAGRLGTATGGSVLVITDDVNPLDASSMEAYAQGVLASYRRELLSQRPVPIAAAVAARPRVGTRTRFAFNPTMESQQVFVPGLLAFVLAIISALMTAISLSREKEMGTLEVLLVSPLRPAQIIPGKVVPYLGLAFLNVVTLLGVAWAVFGVPVRGSLLLLLGESLLFVAASLSLGILIATRTPSQRTAMLGVILGTLLPTALLSGMIFPIESMPDWLRPVTDVVPARWFVAIARGGMLKGASLDPLWEETLVLAAMAAVLLVLAMRSLRPRLG